VPLTDRQAYDIISAQVGLPNPFEDIDSYGPGWAEFMKVVKAIEAAHGIKGAQP
jgi:hypothetical protein